MTKPIYRTFTLDALLASIKVEFGAREFTKNDLGYRLDMDPGALAGPLEALAKRKALRSQVLGPYTCYRVAE